MKYILYEKESIVTNLFKCSKEFNKNEIDDRGE